MKASTLIVVLIAAVLLAGAAFLLLRGEAPAPYELEHDVSLLRYPGAPPVSVVFAADRVEAADAAAVEYKGFVEGVEYHTTTGTLQFRGWAPIDMEDASSSLIVRDPFGASVPSGSFQLEAVERPDVRRTLGDSSADSRYGFALSIPLRQAGSGSAWLRSLEVYAEEGGGTWYALNAASGRSFHTWVKSPDAFELAVVFATPTYAEGAPDGGHIDVVESGSEAGTVRIHGWAPFDARSPHSFLCVRLPRSVAPASIIHRESHLRPDVPPVVDPNRPELQYGGFIISLEISGTAEDLKKKDAFAVWSIQGDEDPVSVHIGKFN